MRTTNLFIVKGYVGQPPKTFGKTTKVSIATNRTYTDAKGKDREETDWVTVTILNERTAKWVAENVQKGDPVYAECRVAEGSYKNGAGETVYTTDVIARTFDSLVATAKGEDD